MTSPETFSEKFWFSSWGVSGDAGRCVFSVVVAPHWEQLLERMWTWVQSGCMYLNMFLLFICCSVTTSQLISSLSSFCFGLQSSDIIWDWLCVFLSFFFFDSSTLVSLSWSESASHFTPPETSLTIAARSFISQPPTSSSCPQRLLFSPHLSPSLVSFLLHMPLTWFANSLDSGDDITW